MTDIIERLRASAATWLEQGGSSPNLHEDAADEIERLRAVLGWIEDHSIDPDVVRKASTALPPSPKGKDQ